VEGEHSHHCAKPAPPALFSTYQGFLLTPKLMTSQVVQTARPLSCKKSFDCQLKGFKNADTMGKFRSETMTLLNMRLQTQSGLISVLLTPNYLASLILIQIIPKEHVS